MELQKHFVAYIDILGFAIYVNENQRAPDKPLQLLKDFTSISKQFNFEDKLSIKAFSDSIVVSMLAKEPSPPFEYDSNYWHFILYINTLQTYIISKIGILPVRGAITYGDFYNHDDILFGEALVEAYNLEHLHAFYPRIVVNPKFLNPNKNIPAYKTLASMGLTGFNSEQLSCQYAVACDVDGILFCNYLSTLWHGGWVDYCDDALNKHKDFIINNLSKTNDVGILRKYTWMKSYHNHFCSAFKELRKFIIPD